MACSTYAACRMGCLQGRSAKSGELILIQYKVEMEIKDVSTYLVLASDPDRHAG